MKKIIISVFVMIILIASGLVFKNYRFEMSDENFGNIGVFGEKVGSDNKVHMMQSEEFPAGIDKIYYEAVARKKSIKEAEITWYNDKDSENPIKTEKVNRSKDGVFISSLTNEEGLESGSYHVEIKIKSKSEFKTEEIKFVVK